LTGHLNEVGSAIKDGMVLRNEVGSAILDGVVLRNEVGSAINGWGGAKERDGLGYYGWGGAKERGGLRCLGGEVLLQPWRADLQRGCLRNLGGDDGPHMQWGPITLDQVTDMVTGLDHGPGPSSPIALPLKEYLLRGSSP
jgi:hypothetical protein